MKRKFKKSWLNGKCVLLTGAGSGIGRELALVLSRIYGCKILAVGRREQNLQSLCEQEPNISAFVADISTQDGWSRIKEHADSLGFSVDVLVNNAGVIHPFKKLIYLTDEQIDKVIDTDYKSIIYSLRAFYPSLKNKKDAGFVTISSASAYLPVAGNAVYSSVKSASLAITEAIRQEVMVDGIFVSAVMPGPVVTDLYEPDGDEEKKAGDDVSKVGLDATVAAKRIAKKISVRKPLINIDVTARAMKLLRKVAPSGTVKLWAKLMRTANRPTFNQVFDDEKPVQNALN